LINNNNFINKAAIKSQEKLIISILNKTSNQASKFKKSKVF